MPTVKPAHTASRPIRSVRLSKSRLLDALQCPRKLWLAVNQPGCAAVSAGQQAIFDTGNQVGEMARRLATQQHGLGELIDVKEPLGWSGGTARCLTALAEPGLHVLFEAPFVHGGLAVICDIVVRHPTGELWLIEVKAATSTKDKPYVDDAALQAWVMTQCRHAPDRVLIRYINSDWVYAGDGDYAGLFSDQDVTAEVQRRLPHVPRLLSVCQQVAQDAEPPIRTGAHCNKPNACGFAGHCQAWEAEQFGDPPEFPIALIGGRFKGKLTQRERQRITDQGWIDLRELPARFPADARARAIVNSVRRGKATVMPGLKATLDSLPYPRYYFDFETINPAIPLWAGTRPYQQVPFQWSCHVEHADGRVKHHEFLDISRHDPRDECARRIVALMGGPDGVVLAYYATFEATRLKELARDTPRHAKGLKRVIAKLQDLYPIVGNHYYHPDMHGSFSIKAVLPTVAPEMDYSLLGEVQHGGAAQQAWLEAVAPGTTAPRRVELQTALLAYCERDTEAMVVLTRKLSSIDNL
jgi:hypothetical protein